MALKVFQYPRGFLALPHDDIEEVQPKIEKIAGDKIVETFYRQYLQLSIGKLNWTYRSATIERFQELIGDIYNFIEINAAHNDYLYGNNWDFFVDTLNFIRTGESRMSLFTWREMCNDEPEKIPGVASAARLAGLNIQPNEFDHYVAKWCSQPDGFEDMLCRAQIMFGVAKSLNLNKR